MVINIRNRYALLIFLFLLIFSCKKEKINYENLSSSEYFSVATSLKNLKNIEKYRINDSLYKVRGLFNNYTISGYVNENNIRIGWWIASDKKDLLAKLDYKLIDNKEFVNQYILFKNGKIDTLNSKFYKVSRVQNYIKYKFYMPVQSDEIRSEGKLNYRYFIQGKVKRHLECKGIKNKNIFDCEFQVPSDSYPNDLIVQGNFWEMFQLKNGNIGQSDIYILDTLK